MIKAMELLTNLAIFIILIFLGLSSIATKRRTHKCLPPEAAGARPLTGHLHLLRGPQLPHITLSNLATKHGPIFAIRLGLTRGLIVNSWEMAKECLTTNDTVLSSRPQTAAVQHLCYDSALFGFHTYDSYWRDIRKIAVTKLLTNHQISLLSNVRQKELNANIRSLYEACIETNSATMILDMNKWFWNVTFEMVFGVVAGNMRRPDLSEIEKWRGTTGEFFKLIAVLTMSDVIPFWPRWLDWGGYQKAMKKTAADMDMLLQKWLDEHKKKQNSIEQQDFMDVMLSMIDDVAGEYPMYDRDTIIKSTCQAMLLGGIDSSTVSLTWTISLLLNHPNVLKKAQEELDLHVGRERQVKESDLEKLVYLQAIIKESLRMYPPKQLTPARESMDDFTIGGYHLSAQTKVYLNLWKIHRDPCVWPNPDDFSPERFLNTHKHVDVKGANFELLPFGGGRRVCPGISFSLLTMQFTIACLLHGFISNHSGQIVDMTQSLGSTNIKETSLEVVLHPRLSSHLYE